MKKLSGRLGNRITQGEPFFQGWHVNKVPAIIKRNKIKGFKNKNFPTGHIRMYTFPGLGLLGVGVSIMRLSQHP